MVSVTLEPEYRIRIEEICGIAHERQILQVAVPPSMPPAGDLPDGTTPLLNLQDKTTGRIFPIQRSLADQNVGFLLIEIEPFDVLDLEIADSAAIPDDFVSVTLTNDPDANYILANGRLALRIDGEIPPGLRRAWR